MQLLDRYDGRVYTLSDIFKQWQVLKVEDPYNHYTSFIVEVFAIMDATYRGRNDIDIIGLTEAETGRLYRRIMERGRKENV